MKRGQTHFWVNGQFTGDWTVGEGTVVAGVPSRRFWRDLPSRSRIVFSALGVLRGTRAKGKNSFCAREQK